MTPEAANVLAGYLGWALFFGGLGSALWELPPWRFVVTIVMISFGIALMLGANGHG